MVKKPTRRYAMSRRMRNTLLVICALALVAIACLDRFWGESLRGEISQHAKWGFDGWRYHGKVFTVVNVVDGDTVDIDIPDGKYEQTRVRLLGMDTPETKSPKVEAMYYGEEATAYAKQLVEGKKVTVILDTVSDVRDMYDRLLAYLEMEDGRILNEELIIAGFAYADLRFAHSQYDEYAAMQEEAIGQEAGLWREVTREQLPKWLQRERPDLLK